LTNHHCGFDAIQNHSSVEHDYLTNGFWAYKMEDELPNKGMVVTFVARIEDVTAKVLDGVSALPNEVDKQKKIQENISNLNKSLPKETWQENSIKTFYDGNQYVLFVTETYKDIRLIPIIGFGHAIQVIFLCSEFMLIKIIILRNIRQITFRINQNIFCQFPLKA
jgi:hypothetical protein